MIWLVLGLISLILIIFWNPVFEHMTNADVQKKLDFHASSPTKWNMTKKSVPDANKQIMGPLVPPKQDEPQPTHDSKTSNGSAVYPEIYGPESLKAPGEKEKEKDSIFTQATYTGFSEFPKGPVNPSPFLSNFSKLHK
jgi:hypothetical protein